MKKLIFADSCCVFLFAFSNNLVDVIVVRTDIVSLQLSYPLYVLSEFYPLSVLIGGSEGNDIQPREATTLKDKRSSRSMYARFLSLRYPDEVPTISMVLQVISMMMRWR